MLIVGLTGGIGSGKSTASEHFKTKNINIIDTDIIARELVAPNTDSLDQIVAHFGRDILLSSGQLDRTKLREIIFNSDEERNWLNQLLHPLIYQHALEKIVQATSPYCIVVIPLLFETNRWDNLDRVLVVDTSEEKQIQHITQRDKVDKQQILAIMEIQATRSEHIAIADDVIWNHSDKQTIIEQVEQLHSFYLSLAK